MRKRLDAGAMSLILSSCIAAGVGVAGYGLYAPNSHLFGRVIDRGSPRGGALYLTFDDGPNPTATPRILELLARARVPATFFQVGRHVALFPALAHEVRAAGHEIGNHTDRHTKLHLSGPRRITRELRGAEEAITTVCGQKPRAFRAPHGYRNPFVHMVAGRLGYTIFGWTFGVWDSARPGAEEIRRRVRQRLRPGAIILLHDGDGYDPHGDRSQTAEALVGILNDARERGYTFRPLSDLFPHDAG